MPNFAYLSYMDGKFLCLGVSDAFVGKGELDFDKLDEFIGLHRGKFVVSMLAYDVKNSVEKLTSKNKDAMDAPDWIFFVPKSVHSIKGDQRILVFGEENEVLLQALFENWSQEAHPIFELRPTLSKEEYVDQVKSAKVEIQIGNCYELNFCQNFESGNVLNLDTWRVFRRMLEQIEAPFSSYLSWDGRTMMGASPERFIKKVGSKLLSQPIKGTRPRRDNAAEDDAMKEELRNDPKERAENVMIVDLVRNDLTQVAKTGTIVVDELFGVYSYQAVHQMISTISCELRDDVRFSEIIRALFPMGSMTGAPKIAAMEIIERLENFKRGWYSGSLGLIQPNGDFDMNVVIRTLLYNENSGYLSCPVGSAITILSDPHAEYEECLTKIHKILALFR